MTWQTVLVMTAIFLLSCLFSYRLGLRSGRREGFCLGQAESVLVLREQALATGCCPSCGTRFRREPGTTSDIIDAG